ncbi:MAG TPA: 3-isopropylmalate dehydratase large subunit [Burkholderiales bacterium]
MKDDPRTLFDKVWARHVVVHKPGSEDLLYVDWNLINEGGAFLGFDQLRAEGRKVRRPSQNIAVTDHYLPTTGRAGGASEIADADIRRVVEMQDENAREFGLEHIDMHDPRQGIAHVIGPELGITQPGLLVTCNDSHTATNGALGALAMPIGAANQLRHVLATQTVWQKKPKAMRISVDGVLPPGVTAKDVILAIIARTGIGGAAGHAVEYAGTTIRALSMEGRMTVCNMSVEAGARIGMIAPDDTTYAYLRGRPHAPVGAEWDRALAFWRTLPTDEGARFDRELDLDASRLAPMVSWGTSPEDCSPITESVPDPATVRDGVRRQRVERALEYMRLKPGTPLASIRVDRVFIGSCTNGRIEDLRSAAQVLKGRRVVVPAMVSPGSTGVKRQAEAEGLDRIFREAGFEWRDSACSMCGGANGDTVAPGERCASTTNRNFEGRQGRGALTHIMSPAMVAAAAVTGRLTDVRALAS